MFQKYFYVTKSGRVVINRSAQLNKVQRSVVEKSLEYIDRGMEILQELEELPSEAVRPLEQLLVLHKLAQLAEKRNQQEE